MIIRVRFPAGRRTLNAEQALAFVRQRHGLDGGDMDRTHRQQAVLMSIMERLQDPDTFTDLGKLDSLIDVAHKDIVLSTGWSEEHFGASAQIAGHSVDVSAPCRCCATTPSTAKTSTSSTPTRSRRRWRQRSAPMTQTAPTGETDAVEHR